MRRPPMYMHLKIQGERKGIGLWLPIFLLLPVAMVLLIIMSPLILIGIMLLWPSGWGKRALLMLKVVLDIFFSLRGLKIDIMDGPKTVYISVV